VLDYHGAITLIQFSVGMIVLSIGASVILYEYLLSKTDEKLSKNEGTVILYRVSSAVLLVLGAYISLLAIIR